MPQPLRHQLKDQRTIRRANAILVSMVCHCMYVLGSIHDVSNYSNIANTMHKHASHNLGLKCTETRAVKGTATDPTYGKWFITQENNSCSGQVDLCRLIWSQQDRRQIELHTFVVIGCLMSGCACSRSWAVTTPPAARISAASTCALPNHMSASRSAASTCFTANNMQASRSAASTRTLTDHV